MGNKKAEVSYGGDILEVVQHNSLKKKHYISERLNHIFKAVTVAE